MSETDEYTVKALHDLKDKLTKIEEEQDDISEPEEQEEERPKNIFLECIKSKSSKTKDNYNTINLLLAQRQTDLERLDKIKEDLSEVEKERDDLERKLHYSKLDLANATCDINTQKDTNKSLRQTIKKLRHLWSDMVLIAVSNAGVNIATMYFVDVDVLWQLLHFMSACLCIFFVSKGHPG